MDEKTNQFEPVFGEPSISSPDQTPPLLTVSQAYDYLITEDLPRSKKTIRKWCRLNHVEKKENTIPGGAKWLITRSSLDARIAEERLIDASLNHETGLNRSEPVPPQTGANPSERVRDDELVEVLKDQLVHERDARRTVEEKNKTLLGMYHEISLASTQMGIEIGKGSQEQAKAHRIGVGNEPGTNQSAGTQAPPRIHEFDQTEGPRADEPEDPSGPHHGGDNSHSGNEGHPVQ